MTQQDEDKGKTTGNTPVQDEQAKIKPAKGELSEKELEKASGGLNPQPLPPGNKLPPGTGGS